MPLNSSSSGPASAAFAITPSDTVDLAFPAKALYVGGNGNVSVILQDDTEAVLFTGLVGGSVYPFQIKRVMNTNTTATSLVALR